MSLRNQKFSPDYELISKPASGGTVVRKFSAKQGSDTMMRGGVSTPVTILYQSITCMNEYQNKSFEELRFEDYNFNRKRTPFTISTRFGDTRGDDSNPPSSNSTWSETDIMNLFSELAVKPSIQSDAFNLPGNISQYNPVYILSNSGTPDVSHSKTQRKKLHLRPNNIFHAGFVTAANSRNYTKMVQPKPHSTTGPTSASSTRSSFNSTFSKLDSFQFGKTSEEFSSRSVCSKTKKIEPLLKVDEKLVTLLELYQQTNSSKNNQVNATTNYGTPGFVTAANSRNYTKSVQPKPHSTTGPTSARFTRSNFNSTSSKLDSFQFGKTSEESSSRSVYSKTKKIEPLLKVDGKLVTLSELYQQTNSSKNNQVNATSNYGTPGDDSAPPPSNTTWSKDDVMRLFPELAVKPPLQSGILHQPANTSKYNPVCALSNSRTPGIVSAANSLNYTKSIQSKPQSTTTSTSARSSISSFNSDDSAPPPSHTSWSKDDVMRQFPELAVKPPLQSGVLYQPENSPKYNPDYFFSNSGTPDSEELEDEDSYEESDERTENDICCPVCFSSMTEIRESNRNLIATICGHILCETCIEHILKSNQKCPKCRSTIIKSENRKIYL